jgi:23S rRNA (uracil1939-C5)-methyltransferase
MHGDVVEAINQSGARVIVYISCNPATQARDIQLLSNYQVMDVQPVDMFPHTHHVENIVSLSLKS